MKKVILLTLLVLPLCQPLFATADHNLKPYVGSSELERLKSLTGIWKGTSAEEDGTKHDANVEYSVTSNGSVVVEKLFSGTPHEMISVYHDVNGKLSMTHYCAIGNQPEMALTSSTEKEMDFVDDALDESDER